MSNQDENKTSDKLLSQQARQHYDTQHKNTHNKGLTCDTQHKNTAIMLCRFAGCSVLVVVISYKNIQHNDTEHNNIQHKNIQHNDTQHNNR